jgi:hypothetical protein
MSRSPVPLKNPVVAAVLAFLVPGLGHLYQGRTFKGLLYAVCILGTFFSGMRIGEGKVVYFHIGHEHRTWYYLCQVWVGLPALPALVQARFRDPESLSPRFAVGETRARCTMDVYEILADGEESIVGTLEGNLVITVTRDEFDQRPWTAKFTGQYRDESGTKPASGEVSISVVEPLVFPDANRRFAGRFSGRVEGRVPAVLSSSIVGAMPRSLMNRYAAPLQDRRISDDRWSNSPTDLDEANGRLGGRFELGVLYTVVAGLLNVLAIFDALDGPARERKPDPDAPPDSDEPPKGGTP